MKKRETSRESLCCCEYDNLKGERSHIAASLCDCEALDTMFDRCITCKGIDEDLYTRFWSTISDRIRIPWCSGKGAVRVHPDIAVPLIIVPLCLLISALHWYLTVIFLPLLPILMLFHYRMWTKSTQKIRTKLFFCWGMVSAWFLYFIFMFYVPSFRIIGVTKIVSCNVLFAWTHYFLYQAKKDPGIIIRPAGSALADSYSLDDSENAEASQNSTKQSNEAQNSGRNSPTHNAFWTGVGSMQEDTAEPEKYGALGTMLINNFGFSQQMFDNKIKEDQEIFNETIPAHEVDWVDSRPIEGDRLIVWCAFCKLKKPPRAGHCPVCNVCIQVRDHHCVWIDTCIGAKNHRSFFIALVLFIVGTLYGCWHTLDAVCSTTKVFHVNGPFDCEFVYFEYGSALCYVSVVYSATVAIGMIFVVANQMIFISQNLTGQELYRAAPRGWVKYCFFAKHNVNNKGFIRNWVSFLRGHRKHQQSYGPLTSSI